MCRSLARHALPLAAMGYACKLPAASILLLLVEMERFHHVHSARLAYEDGSGFDWCWYE